MKQSALRETNFEGLGPCHRGKVRDIYDLGNRLLLITSDRISAFDVVMNEPVPDKGRVLTALSVFWFRKFAGLVPNHLISINLNDLPSSCLPYWDELDGRFMLIRKCKPLPVEAIVRGYLSGSGWKDYQETRKVCGIPLPRFLTESDRLSRAIFTPSTKADLGAHDVNIPFEEAAVLVGVGTAEFVRDMSLKLYGIAHDYALERGIIIADTKFEFGLDENEELTLIDEVLTPDSSRFWPRATYRPGGPQKSY
ncbi:MAG: phosphoribosylaminoimidazolesuccinocarboxamide synthase, partial [Candidatus Moranbacteria bacterium RBG_13_45_13]